MDTCRSETQTSEDYVDEFEERGNSATFAGLAGLPPPRGDVEPPRKRRRYDERLEGERSGLQVEADGSISFPSDVVLAHIDTTLTVDDDGRFVVSEPAGPTSYGTPMELVQMWPHEIRGDLFELSLWRDHISLKFKGHLDATAGFGVKVAQLNSWFSSTRHGGSKMPSHLKYVLRPVSDDPRSARLEAWLLWRKGVSVAGLKHKSLAAQYEMLSLHLPETSVTKPHARSVSDFYDNVHVPAAETAIPQAVETVDLECALYPFQQRAIAWLLRREKVAFEHNQLVSIAQQEAKTAPSPFVPVVDASGRQVYFNLVEKVFLDAPKQSPDLYGGILCEEMGLGKTVELLALIILHRRDRTPHRHFESLVDPGLIQSGATLIICPPHILSQWQSEISRHAPHLKVLHYTGLQAESRAKTQTTSDPLSLLQYDIVLTTYNVLSREIHYAETPPERNLRRAKKHEARRSPLVQISWWRVCLDEAQMIEGGVSKAATVARLIPRINAFAVSGTPLKKDLDDLFGLLLFLWYEPFCLSKKAWSEVDQCLFKRIIGNIAMRHTKDLVRQELRIPEQKRIVLTMPFTAVEDQNYSSLIQQMCDDCGLTLQGEPATNDVDFTSPALVDMMRSWLRRLRQVCLHPQVGHRNRRALGRKGGPLKTVSEVLDTMIEQNETTLRAEQRQVVLAKVRYTHVLANDKSNTERWPAALEAYNTALAQATDFVNTIREELKEERAKEALKTTSDTPAKDSDGSPNPEEMQEQNVRLGTLQKALRSALEVRHVCAFFVGTAYYQLKMDEKRTVPDSDDFHRLEKLETDYYETAKGIRKEMLHDWDEAAHRSMRKVRDSTSKSFIPEVPELEDYGGIESRKHLSNLDAIGRLLDDQAAFVEKLRAKVGEYLLLDLIDQDEGKDTTGEEYEDSTKKQDELPIYVTVLAAAVADRHHLLTGQTNFLVDHETKEAEKVAKRGEGHAPELLRELLETRRKALSERKPGGASAALREVISQIRSTITSLQWSGGDEKESRASRELAIVNDQLRDAQKILTAQSKAVTELERELELFRSTMNQRNEFYRQLQIISDTVAPYKEELDENLDLVALQKETLERERAEQKLASLNTKRRFLLHLQTESTSDEARICVICQGGFEHGVLTVCGHQYCKDCIREWWRAHRTCPVCKRHLNMVDFHDITYKPSELHAQEEEHTTPSYSPSNPSGKSIIEPGKPSMQIYSTIGTATLKEIKNIDIDGSYGTKIDSIAKHILWIREHDPGAKSIIFSQFGEFLQVLRGAFRHFKIGHAVYSDTGAVDRFKKDASVECLLLDAKSDSSGLNLINATHVFFCEPLINTAIELQAIARVHRIGQQRNTTVYMYLISDTVEESIYKISVSRRMAHLSQNKNKQTQSGSITPKLEEMALDAANSRELQRAPLSAMLVKNKIGGEFVAKDDLWQCLFGKSRARREQVSGELDREVNRFLRAEAAEERRTAEARVP